MPSAIAMTVCVNISRDPVRTACASSQGSTREATASINATNATTLPSTSARAIPVVSLPAGIRRAIAATATATVPDRDFADWFL